MKCLLLLVCFAAACQAIDEWSLFKKLYNKDYSNGLEELQRVKIFTENKQKIEEHNARYAKGLESHSVKMNRFGDMETHEFKAMMNGLRMGMKKPSTKIHQVTNLTIPTTVDWRDQGAVTPVKDQGQCGSCWSFSTTGSLEGQTYLKTGNLISLSEQNLVDCSGDYGNQGCNGGLMDSAFQYIQANGGIDTESSYPYTAEDGSCQFSASDVGATDNGFVDVSSGDESALQDAVANVGPISIAIDASNWSFQFYSGGVYNEPDCSSTSLDHGVLAVGYGSDSGTDYWLVKNSWGSSWGLDGYIMMSRNQDNQCGVATMASYPTV